MARHSSKDKTSKDRASKDRRSKDKSSKNKGKSPKAGRTETGPALTHIDSGGEARMVDVSDKPATERIAVAEGCVASVSRLAAEGLTATTLEVTLVRLPLVNWMVILVATL